MQRLAIDKIREHFPRAAMVPGVSSSHKSKSGETDSEVIARKTAEFLADDGVIEQVEPGVTNYVPSIGIVINSDKDRPARRHTKKK
jgi:hypothetical protein